LTKEELKRISFNNRKIEKLKEKYSSLKYKSQAKGQVLTGMPHVSGTSDTVGDYVAQLTSIKEELVLMELETELLIKRARRFIASIPDYTIQAIVELKYINNLYYTEVIAFAGAQEIKTEKDIDRLLNTFFLDTLLYL
jgi:hypothetical protein